MASLCIHGAGGHAVSVLEAARHAGFDEMCLIDPGLAGTQVFDVPVLAACPWVDSQHVVAIGDNHLRWLVSEHLARGGAAFAVLVHPSASVAVSASLSPGTVVLQNACVAARARLATGCLVNSGAIVEHDNFLGDFVSLGPRAVLGGDCRIGPGSAIGIGAVVRHGVTIGAGTVVGGAAYVHADLPDEVVAFGVPAQVVRGRARGDPYL